MLSFVWPERNVTFGPVLKGKLSDRSGDKDIATYYSLLLRVNPQMKVKNRCFYPRVGCKRFLICSMKKLCGERST